MEECIICFEEKEEHDFILFSCSHKTCVTCFHTLMNMSTPTPCPLCQQPITIYMSKDMMYQVIPVFTPRQNVPQENNLECCRIIGCIFIFAIFLFVIVNYSYNIKN
jgi:hypothetical protein